MLCWSSAETALSSQPRTYLTEEEYLELERKAEYKSEYYQGEMFAMAGASLPHNVLMGNLVAILNTQLRSGHARCTRDGRWVLSEASRLEDTLELRSIGCHLALADLYEKVDLAGPGAKAETASPRMSGATSETALAFSK